MTTDLNNQIKLDKYLKMRRTDLYANAFEACYNFLEDSDLIYREDIYSKAFEIAQEIVDNYRDKLPADYEAIIAVAASDITTDILEEMHNENNRMKIEEWY